MKELICSWDIPPCKDAPDRVMMFDKAGKTFPRGRGKDSSHVGVLGSASSALCRFLAAASPRHVEFLQAGSFCSKGWDFGRVFSWSTEPGSLELADSTTCATHAGVGAIFIRTGMFFCSWQTGGSRQAASCLEPLRGFLSFQQSYSWSMLL